MDDGGGGNGLTELGAVLCGVYHTHWFPFLLSLPHFFSDVHTSARTRKRTSSWVVVVERRSACWCVMVDRRSV